MNEEAGNRWNQARKAWDEVGERFTEVGRKVGDHYRKLDKESPPTKDAQRRDLNEAVQGAVEGLDQAFTSLGNAIRDPEAKQSLNRAARSFGEALSATLSGLSGEIRGKLRSGDAPKEEGGS